MNKSRWASEGNLHFPLKETKTDAGESRITCNLAPDKEWVRPTTESAIRAARNELTAMQEKAQIESAKPKWMTSGEWKKKETA